MLLCVPVYSCLSCLSCLFRGGCEGGIHSLTHSLTHWFVLSFDQKLNYRLSSPLTIVQRGGWVGGAGGFACLTPMCRAMICCLLAVYNVCLSLSHTVRAAMRCIVSARFILSLRSSYTTPCSAARCRHSPSTVLCRVLRHVSSYFTPRCVCVCMSRLIPCLMRRGAVRCGVI